MTASLNLTPSQAKWMQAHKERKERIEARARPDTPILCLSASARSGKNLEAESIPAETDPPTATQQWVQRQISKYTPWFQIVEEIEPPLRRPPLISFIQQLCCDHFKMAMADLLSGRRHVEIVRTRQVAMFLCKEFTSRSFPEIGRRFGGRDHTTVLHAIRTIKRKESEDNELAADLEVLRQQIREAS